MAYAKLEKKKPLLSLLKEYNANSNEGKHWEEPINVVLAVTITCIDHRDFVLLKLLIKMIFLRGMKGAVFYKHLQVSSAPPLYVLGHV